jgi:hypothetical protein
MELCVLYEDVQSSIWRRCNGLSSLNLVFDRAYGGAECDTIQGGLGNDQLFGEGGDDQIFGGFDDGPYCRWM